MSIACGSSTPATQVAADRADLVVINGRVVTMDDAGTVAEAVAVKGSTVLKVGTTVEIRALAGPQTRIIDAHGGSVTPGFNDSHVHFLAGGLSLADVDLAGLNTLDEVQRAIRTFVADKPADAWVRGRGWLYTPFPGGSPTAAQLDALVGDRPAVMNCYDGHSIWVNSKVLALAKITRDTRNPVNGLIVKDPKTGEPTGHLKEAAADLVRRVMPKPTEEEKRAALRAAVALAHRYGVTSVQNAGTSLEEMALYVAARQAGDLKVRAYVAGSARSGFAAADLDRLDAMRQQLGDDPTLKTGIVKMFADGVIESRTAAMLAPYEGLHSAGEPNLAAGELNRVVALLDSRGWQVQIHAIGDRAIRMALDAFEKAAAANPAPARGRRHRIEHIEAVSAADSRDSAGSA